MSAAADTIRYWTPIPFSRIDDDDFVISHSFALLDKVQADGKTPVGGVYSMTREDHGLLVVDAR